jgi:hypothetical protein
MRSDLNRSELLRVTGRCDPPLNLLLLYVGKLTCLAHVPSITGFDCMSNYLLDIALMIGPSPGRIEL